MNEAMRATLEEVELDPAIRCVVLTGAGKGFCAGGDVKGMASSGDGTVGDNTIDAAIHRQRVHQRATAGNFLKCQNLPLLLYQVPQLVLVYLMHLHVTLELWRVVPL